MPNMVHIEEKRDVFRKAIAKGTIKLNKTSFEHIVNNNAKKGNVLETAQVAAILAVKNTPQIVPLCHPIPITGVDIDFSLKNNAVTVTVSVSSLGKTGVEMEAITGVSAALLTVWDMIKMYEKNEQGQYPSTKISNIQVVRKEKG